MVFVYMNIIVCCIPVSLFLSLVWIVRVSGGHNIPQLFPSRYRLKLVCKIHGWIVLSYERSGKIPIQRYESKDTRHANLNTMHCRSIEVYVFINVWFEIESDNRISNGFLGRTECKT